MMKAPKQLVWLTCTLLLASCSIIEDSDVRSPEEILTLEAITITQIGQEGTNNLGSANVTNDASGKIQRIDWSGLSGDGDFRFRTGDRPALGNLQSTAYITNNDQPVTLTTFFAEYDSNDRILRIINEMPGFQFESYDFTYDSQGRLVGLTTTYGDDTEACVVAGVDCGGAPDDATIQFVDEITYSSGNKIDFITRTVRNAAEVSQGVIYVSYGRQPGSSGSSSVTDADIGGVVVRELGLGAAIPSKDDIVFENSDDLHRYTYFQNEIGNWFGGPLDIRIPDTNDQPFQGNVDMLVNINGNIFASLEISDFRLFGNGDFQNEGFGGRTDARQRLPDYFYFHPFMLFPDRFPNGVQLMQAYFSDWWIVNQEVDNSFEFTANRDLTMEFGLSK